MVIIENKNHTITKLKEGGNNRPALYKVLEYCNILEEKEEVKYVPNKTLILQRYNII